MSSLKSGVYRSLVKASHVVPSTVRDKLYRWISARPWISNRIMSLAPTEGDWDIEMQGGYRMVVPRSSQQGIAAAVTGTYDEDEFLIALQHIEPGSTVLDIGACMGFWTVPLVVRSTAGQVIAFEPVAANREILAHNLARNGIEDRVRIEPCGLGEAAAELSIRIEAGGAGNAAILPTHPDFKPKAGRVAATISVRPLDQIDPIPGRCSFMKIDVEGFEIDALRGGEAFIANHRPVILGEFSLGWFNSRRLPVDAAEAWARAHDYTTYELRPNSRGQGRSGLTQVEITIGMARTGDELLLVPNDAQRNPGQAI